MMWSTCPVRDAGRDIGRPGPEQLHRSSQRLRAAVPDLTCDLEDLLVAGNRPAARLRMRGRWLEPVPVGAAAGRAPGGSRGGRPADAATSVHNSTLRSGSKQARLPSPIHFAYNPRMDREGEVMETLEAAKASGAGSARVPA
jgi:hypothetical protein